MRTEVIYKLTSLLLLLCLVAPVQASDCVVLLHGLAKSNSDMRKLTSALNKAGYETVNYDYWSRQYPIEVLAPDVINNALKQCPEHQQIHFVTHSMGGILVRAYLANHHIEKLGKVVMLGPPNNGSEVIDTYRNWPGVVAFLGPASAQLGTDDTSVPLHIGEANFEVGIIAGKRTLNPILSMILPGKDDGKVTVESTKLAGMKDHIVMPVTHPFMMRNKRVIQQVLYFLQHGEFEKITA